MNKDISESNIRIRIDSVINVRLYDLLHVNLICRKLIYPHKMILVYSREDAVLVNVESYHGEPTEIDMFNHPELGQNLIHWVYQNFNVGQMPDRFKTIILYFSSPQYEYPKIKDDLQFEQIFIQCLNQWKPMLSLKNFQLTRDGSQCCCSHEISNLFFVKNSQNGNVLLVGSECIKKLGHNSQLGYNLGQLKKLIAECEHCHQPTCIFDMEGHCCVDCQEFKVTNRRACKVCFKFTETKGYGRCKSCWKAKRTGEIDIQSVDENFTEIIEKIVVCPGCQEKFYQPDSWRTYCKTCYVKSQDEDDSIPCETCKTPFCPDEDWKIDCPKCYAMKRNTMTQLEIQPQTHTQPQTQIDTSKNKICDDCGKEFQTDQDWKTVCLPCYKKNSIKCVDCNRPFRPKFKGASRCYPCYQKTLT